MFSIVLQLTSVKSKYTGRITKSFWYGIHRASEHYAWLCACECLYFVEKANKLNKTVKTKHTVKRAEYV